MKKSTQKEKENVLEVKETKERKKYTIVTSRVLFISILDKIYLVILAIMLGVLTIANFSGNISSVSYKYWSRIGSEIGILIFIVVTYFIMNWVYKCVAKTMLCLTKTEVYKETYLPFKRNELSIPLNKITAVSTHNVFWIFRSIIIHQYGKLPLIFFTWNNQEFKDELNKLITKTEEHPSNSYECKNIIEKKQYKLLMYIGAGLATLILLLGVVRFFTYIFSKERSIAGSYIHGKNQIVLKKDGSCNIDDLVTAVEKCNWKYNSDAKTVNITYTYTYASIFSSYSTYSAELVLQYDKDHKELNYNNTIYSK